MDDLFRNIRGHRTFLHVLFWMAWVFGFTFIKSFGQGLEVYAGWLVYYFITLPVFIVHTYLIVYWAIPQLLKGWRIVLFLLVFVVAVYLFSLLEILITQEFLEGWFPEIFTEALDRNSVKDVMISGVGNLYIVLVFIAVREVRGLYLAEGAQRELEKKKLDLMKASTKSGLQPNMLLQIMKAIENMANEKSERTASAIAELSELLGALMQAKELGKVGLDEEIANVKKMCRLYGIIQETKVPSITIENIAGVEQVPAFMIFSPLEIALRVAKTLPATPIEIDVKGDCEITISIALANKPADLLKTVQQELDELFPEKYSVSSHQQRVDMEKWCSLTISCI